MVNIFAMPHDLNPWAKDYEILLTITCKVEGFINIILSNHAIGYAFHFCERREDFIRFNTFFLFTIQKHRGSSPMASEDYLGPPMRVQGWYGNKFHNLYL